MSDPRPTGPLLLPALLATLLIALVVQTWATRVSYPYDLEWMEGGVLAHAWRLQHGKPIYVVPSVEFIPMIYPPGYPTVLAILGWFPGLSHTLGRLVSISGTLAATAAMVYAARRHLGSTLFGVIGAGLFLGLYLRSGGFYDLVRPDGLMMGLLTWAIVLSLNGDERSLKASGLLLFTAFTVKHNAASYGFPLAFGVLLRHGLGPARTFVLWAAAPGLVFTIAMQILTGGLFTVWLLDVPRSHAMVYNRVFPGTVRELGATFGPILGFLTVWILSLGPRLAPKLPAPALTLGASAFAALAWVTMSGMGPVDGIDRPLPIEASLGYLFFGVALFVIPMLIAGTVQGRRIDADAWFVAVLFATSWFTTAMMRGHQGGFLNVFIPFHWVMCGLIILALHDAWRRLPPHSAGWVVSGVAAVQLGLFLYRWDGDRLAPERGDREAGDAVVAWMTENAEPPILSPFNPWLAAQSGHEPGWHLIALWDIRHPTGPFREQGIEILDQIKRGHYGTVIDSDDGADLGFLRAYEKTHTFQSDRRTFLPKTGWRARPNVVWTRQ
jgi:hypothetical protein